MNPAYFADMAVVDERLTKLEKAYDEIAKLLTGLSMDIKAITNASKEGVKQSGVKEKSNKSGQRQKSF